jgi:hypothetical protein
MTPRKDGSRDEKRQLDELEAGHPWCLTLRDFLEKVRSDYGFSGPASFETEDPRGKPIRNPYLIGRDGERVYLPAGLELDEQLDQYVTQSLCRRMRIPPENFGLPAVEPEED